MNVIFLLMAVASQIMIAQGRIHQLKLEVSFLIFTKFKKQSAYN